MHLSVLDQSPIRPGSDAATALSESVTLAQHVEALGYARYWVAEHHGSVSFAGSAPEILIGQIAARTQRIRVGSAGVMLMHYSPLKVAESFKVLECFYPGRLDLGIGRAPGSDGITAAALAYGSQIGVEYLPAKIADLQAFLADDPPLTEALAKVRATPGVATQPRVWMLGSTTDGAQMAARFGLPYSHAHFIGPETAEAAAEIYRTQFRPHSSGAEPCMTLGVFALCADTEARAAELGACRDLWRLRAEQGVLRPYPSVEEAAAYTFSPNERSRLEARRPHLVQGTREQVGEQLRALAKRCQVNELSVLSITPDFADRLRNYELLATEFGLQPAA